MAADSGKLKAASAANIALYFIFAPRVLMVAHTLCHSQDWLTEDRTIFSEHHGEPQPPHPGKNGVLFKYVAVKPHIFAAAFTLFDIKPHCYLSAILDSV